MNGKVLRDDESKGMLDIIFQNKLFDIGLINNIANFRTMFQTLESNGSTDVSSTYAASLDSAKAALEKNQDKLRRA